MFCETWTGKRSRFPLSDRIQAHLEKLGSERLDRSEWVKGFCRRCQPNESDEKQRKRNLAGSVESRVTDHKVIHLQREVLVLKSAHKIKNPRTILKKIKN